MQRFYATELLTAWLQKPKTTVHTSCNFSPERRNSFNDSNDCDSRPKIFGWQTRKGGREAEGGGLLNRYTGYTVSWVRIPSLPPFSLF